MKMIVFLGILVCGALAAFGQDAIRVGESVDYTCARQSGSLQCGGTVEAINGNTVRIRYGNVRSQVDVVPLACVCPKPKPPSQVERLRWDAFNTAVLSKNKADVYLRIYAHYYQPDEFSYAGGTPTEPQGWQHLTATMAEIDALCKGQYRGITNSPFNLRPGDVASRYADWCKMADKRLTLEPMVRAGAAKYMLNPTTGIDIKKAIEHSRNLVWDQEQMILFEPAKYKAKVAQDLKQRFADYGTPMPADFFDDVDKQAAELKAVIDRTAPTKAFSKPSFQDAAAQAAVKRTFASKYPGSQIVSIGSRYPKWEKRTGADLTGMGTGYKLYTLTTNFYKAGDMLVKIPNRPYCQMRSWTVRQSGMVAILGEAGEFMKCE